MISTDGPILLDGAMGTYLESEYGIPLRDVEAANLTHPHTVIDVHRQYIAAGSNAILTNTYAANTVLQDTDFDEIGRIIDAACDNAYAAASGTDTQIYACIGPIYGSSDPLPEYRAIVDRFAAHDISNFALQTFADPEGMADIAAFIRSVCPDATIMCMGTVGSDGYSPHGVPVQQFLDEMAAIPDADVVGFNCTCGPEHMLRLYQALHLPLDKATVVMPNAGFPHYELGRTVYASSPEYFAGPVTDMARLGVQYVGGCCGTAPAHIQAIAQALKTLDGAPPEREAARPKAVPAPAPEPVARQFVAVELDPPADPGASDKFFDRAVAVQRSGADIITIADCPVGRARGDSSVLAAVLRQHNIDVMPHLTCRDRNINASKALLLGMHMTGVRNVLLVTGDPVPASERERVQTVFQFDSVRFMQYMRSLNGAEFAESPFRVAGALNVNAMNFDAELARARKKVDAGMQMMLTQPVMDDYARANLRRTRQELGIPILAGIMPIVSYRNACFVNNEMGGINVPADVVASYEHASREEAGDLAVRYALEHAKQVRDDADGYYVITTLGRADIVSEIVQEIKSWS